MAYENGKLAEGSEIVLDVDGKEVKVNRITYDEDTGNHLFAYRLGEGRDHYGIDDFILVIRGIPVENSISRNNSEQRSRYFSASSSCP